jgi:hypothetical protein
MWRTCLLGWRIMMRTMTRIQLVLLVLQLKGWRKVRIQILEVLLILLLKGWRKVRIRVLLALLVLRLKGWRKVRIQILLALLVLLFKGWRKVRIWILLVLQRMGIRSRYRRANRVKLLNTVSEVGKLKNSLPDIRTDYLSYFVSPADFLSVPIKL